MPDQFDALAQRFGGVAEDSYDKAAREAREQSPPPSGGPLGYSAGDMADSLRRVGSALGPDNWPMLGGALGGLLGAGAGSLPLAAGGAALGGAAGEAYGQLAHRVMGKPAPGTMTEAATEIGKEGATQGAIEGAGGLVTKGAGALGTSVYRGYLKPALNAGDLPKAREIVSTALREALPITKGGETRGARLIAEINKQVGGLLQDAKGAVDLHKIADRVRTFAKERYYRPGVDVGDYKAANDVADLIDKHPSLGLPEGASPTRLEVSPTQANQVKQDVRPNSRAYGQQGAGPEAAARKQAGHELRTELEGIEPSIGPMNNRERQLIDAVEAVTKASGREENRAILSVPNMFSLAAGSGYGAQQNDPLSGMALAVASRLALSPAVASRMAILASKFGRVPGTGVALALRMAAQVALSEQDTNQPDQGQQPERQ